MFKRLLNLALPPRQSIFLWGARQTGKSSYLKKTFPRSVYYDLLNTQQLVRFTKSPHLLREEVLAIEGEQLKQPIIIDEVQKVPELLNEIHWLIENTEAQFILCGSSARKFKTQQINLLGGRAWLQHFYPMVYKEIPNFNLNKALQHGLIPKHYLAEAEHIDFHLQAYIDIYLTDEIRNEGLVRNLAGFARFLDVAGLTSGEMLNATNVARDCGIDRLTVQGYYQILLDTLLGYYIYPYRKKIKRDIIAATPKFYLFDVGVANYLARRSITDLKGSAAGQSFEHYILMELIAYRDLKHKKFNITYWRTKSGLEVDFILEQSLNQPLLALEIKISTEVKLQDLKGIVAFCEEHPSCRGIIISQDPKPRKIIVNEQISLMILPWQNFLENLWSDVLI